MFSVEWDIDQDTKMSKMLKLCLQPIIENSITHGIIPRRDNEGKISIRVYKSEDNLIADIEDNGVGIPQSKIVELRQQLAEGNVKSKHGVGISNVNQRIKLIYGTDCGIELYSGKDKTIVSLKKSETKFDDKENLRYVEVEGTCDTTNPYGKTFVSNVDPNDYTKSLRPKRRCYENGTWGPIENLCVLFNACNELSLNVLDLSNLILQEGDVNKMNKVINRKLLAQADCSKPGSYENCYEDTYNVNYINSGFETNGLPVEEKTIQNSIKETMKDSTVIVEDIEGVKLKVKKS